MTSARATVAPVTPHCACGCGVELPYARVTPRKWAKKSCYMRAVASRRKCGANGSKRTEPLWHPAWKERVADVVAVLRELGPMRTSSLYAECVGRFGWKETMFVNVLAAGHPGLVEKNGVWRARDAV